MIFSRFVLPSLAVLCAALPLSAQVIAFDNFSSGSLADEPGDPLDMPWYAIGVSSNSVSVVDGAIENNPGTSTFRGMLGYLPTSINLATLPVGQGVRLVFDIRALATPASNTSGFRFGFHTSNGPRGTASLDSAFQNDAGYYARLSFRTDAATGSNAGGVVRDAGTEGGGLAGADNTTVSGGSGTGGALFGGTTMQRFGFEIIRSGDTAVTMNIFQGNDLTLVYTATDSASPLYNLDTITIGLGSVVTGLRVDDVTVTQVIPEPSTYALLGGSAGALLLLARRRRR